MCNFPHTGLILPVFITYIERWLLQTKGHQDKIHLQNLFQKVSRLAPQFYWHVNRQKKRLNHNWKIATDVQKHSQLKKHFCLQLDTRLAT